MAAGGVGQDFQGGKLAAGLHGAESLFAGRSLVPQLDDVHSAGQRGVGELGQIAAVTAGVGTQVQPRLTEHGVGFVHTATVAASVVGTHGSPGSGG